MIPYMKLAKDLVAASAAPLVLAILEGGETYGYAIIGRVRELSGGRVRWTDGMLYPVLHRLEAKARSPRGWRTARRPAAQILRAGCTGPAGAGRAQAAMGPRERDVGQRVEPRVGLRRLEVNHVRSI